MLQRSHFFSDLLHHVLTRTFRPPLIIAMALSLAVIMAFVLPVRAAPLEQESDPNKLCMACHSIPDRKVKLANGETLPLYIDHNVYTASVHGQEKVLCTSCHTNISGYPHPQLAANDYRDFQIDRYVACRNCHVEQYEATLDSMHAAALAGGNRDAALCTDCHGAHDIGDPAEPRQKTSVTCSLCHASHYEDYNESVHGEALMADGNPDVPTCVDCHGVHAIHDPLTAEFRLKSPEICGECHRDTLMMDKYDISTEVFETYVADFHGTTVTLFDRQSPDQATNKAVCFDCHGVHNIKAVTDPEATVVKENLLITCQRCHPGADTNFPTSWTSHHIPDRENNPLVYYINLFYAIIIPAVVGFMVLFVSLDAVRRITLRFRPRKSGGAKHE